MVAAHIRLEPDPLGGVCSLQAWDTRTRDLRHHAASCDDVKRKRGPPRQDASALCANPAAVTKRNLAPAQTLHWRDWYSLQSWRRRAKHQLATAPLCALCEEQGCIIPATIADHHPPHKGDWNAFRLGPFRSLCRDCHSKKWADDFHGYRSAIDD
jgi:hypothetical protein